VQPAFLVWFKAIGVYTARVNAIGIKYGWINLPSG